MKAGSGGNLLFQIGLGILVRRRRFDFEGGRARTHLVGPVGGAAQIRPGRGMGELRRPGQAKDGAEGRACQASPDSAADRAMTSPVADGGPGHAPKCFKQVLHGPDVH